MKIILTKTHIHYLIVLISVSAVLGSLYIGFFGDPIQNIKDLVFFDSGRNIPPCSLCWYQRMFIYPVALISLISLKIKDQKFIYYIVPLIALTILFASYHVYIQENGSGIIPCEVGRPCNVKEFEYLGFITIPVLSLMVSVSIAALSIIYLRKKD